MLWGCELTSLAIRRRGRSARRAGHTGTAALSPETQNAAVQVIAHAVKHGDVSPADALLRATLRPQRATLVQFLEMYGPFAYMKDDQNFAYFKGCKALKEAGIKMGGDLTAEYASALYVSQAVAPPPVGTKTSEAKHRKYRESDLESLSDDELQNLRNNAERGSDPALARRCEQHLGARRLASQRPDLFVLLGTSPRVKDYRHVFADWPRSKLERCRNLLEGSPLPDALENARNVLISAMAQELRMTRRRAGGSPVVQGGRGDGNKPSGWDRKR